jgi:hypothetical protein
MAKMIGYLITWTTYGSWLQGDKRGYVKNGKTYPSKPSLFESNSQRLSKEAVKLAKEHRQIVTNAILNKAVQLNQKIYALAVTSKHIHIVADYIHRPIGRVVSHYKNASQIALRKAGLCGKIWTKGFDKRYCFDGQSLRNRINYVESHNNNHIAIVNP